ncbi:tetratricopeptide repeat protein [Candidatus Falkowbacteria bacterium]|nr:tetratricopeptide repeat protein [Candidatus Falkowbacteria bacterium]
MYDIIPLVLLILSFGFMAAIAIRKFPALASLDVDNIPAEKEARFKERILSNRLKRKVLRWYAKVARVFRPILGWLAEMTKGLYGKLHDLKEKYRTEQPITAEDVEKKIALLFTEIEELVRSEDYLAAEKRLIEIISLDSKNIRAFKLLGHVYVDKKDYEEAKQTFEHILKLKADDEEVYEDLALVARASGNLDLAKEDYLKSLEINNQRAQTFYNLANISQETKDFFGASEYIQKALKLEQNSPRYLDTAIEISIIIKDKVLALNAYDRLSKVNPENQKLAEFKQRIDEI